MRRRSALFAVLLLILALTVAACGTATPTAEPDEQPADGETTEQPTEPPAAEPTEAPVEDETADGDGEEPFRVAFVYVAPIGDLGWTWTHEQARLAIEEEFGDEVETAYVESVPEGPESERVIRDFAQKGFDLIFTTSFGYMDPTINVADEFPETWFVHISGFKTADNVSTVFGRMYQPRYLSGLVAGSMTESDVIGYVAAFPIPEVVRGINAFTLGVRHANPDAQVRVVWTNTWFGPPEEKEAAEALLAEGADVIAQHQDTTEPQKAAQDEGAFGIGYNSDMQEFVGESVLTGPVWDWAPKYIEITRQVMEGTYETESYWGGLDEGVVKLAPLSDQVPDDVRQLVEEERERILNGEWDVFCGPVNGQDGELVVPEGKCLSDSEMLNIEWFVEGVRGDAPSDPPDSAGEEDAPTADEAAASEEAAASSDEEFRAAWVYVGPVGDLGWSYAHDQGRLAVEESLPYLETAYSETVPEPDVDRVLRDYARQGYDMIFATSFGYMDGVISVAEEFPDVLFEHATGYETAENVSTYDGRGYEGWYLAGITAGHMTESDLIGYVAPFPIPEVVRNMNAFLLGAQSVNPDVELRIVWINAWFDPPQEREAAQALIDAGADVIARESDSPEPDKAAEEAGVYAIGYNAVSPDIAPDAVLTAPIWDWSVYYEQTIEAAHDGEWETHQYWGSMADGIMDLAPFGDMVPEDVQDDVNAAKEEIISGDLHPFTGPISDNTGELRVEEGEVMSDEALLSFDWLVEGVVGEIPQ